MYGFGMSGYNSDSHIFQGLVPDAVLQQVTVIRRFVPYSSSDGCGLSSKELHTDQYELIILEL